MGVRGKDVVVLGVEKKAVAKLQDERTVQKICVLDNHVMMAFAGLTADARIIIKKARQVNSNFFKREHRIALLQIYISLLSPFVNFVQFFQFFCSIFNVCPIFNFCLILNFCPIFNFLSDFRPISNFFSNFSLVDFWNFCPIFNLVQFSILSIFQSCPLFNLVQFQFCPILTISSRAIVWNFQSCFLVKSEMKNKNFRNVNPIVWQSKIPSALNTSLVMWLEWSKGTLNMLVDDPMEFPAF